jgi:hypothetical protein
VSSRGFTRAFGSASVTVAAGNAASLDGGPQTTALVFKPTTSGADQGLIEACNASNAVVWCLLLSDTHIYLETSAGFQPLGTYSAGNWYTVVAGKDNGSAPVHWELCDMGTDTWTSGDTGNLADATTGPVDHVNFAKFSGSNYFDGLIAAAGVFAAKLDQTQSRSLRTGLSAWASLSPVAGWPFNVPVAGTVVDFTNGGADQTAITDTGNQFEGEDPPGFDFSLGVDATLDATGPAATATNALSQVDPATLDATGPTATATSSATVEDLATLLATGPAATATNALSPLITATMVATGPAATAVMTQAGGTTVHRPSIGTIAKPDDGLVHVPTRAYP